MVPAVRLTPRPLGQPCCGGSTVDHLEQVKAVRQQLAAALAAYPHDYEEAYLRLQAADNVLAALEAEGVRELADSDAWLDAAEAVALAEGQL